MNKISICLVLGIIVLLSSCAKEEFTSDSEFVHEKIAAEVYLANELLPAILFSYNVYNAESNTLSSWLIDTDGNIRSSQTESDLVFESGALSPYYMDAKKDRSTASETTADLDELVENFVKLRNASDLEYDSSFESEEAQNMTTVYGYYFQSASDSEDCGCSGESSSSSSLQLYEPILLEQKAGGKVIQTNSQAKEVLAWINSLNVQSK